MAVLSVTIPNTGRVPTVLLDVAARAGFPVGPTYPTPQAALAAWLQAHLRELYRQQARPGAREQAHTDAEVRINTDANTIT